MLACRLASCAQIPGDNLLSGDWERGAMGSVGEDQECVADVSWSHRQRPGVDKSAVS